MSTTDPSETAAGPWRAVAPSVFDRIDRIEARARAELAPDLLAAVRAAVEAVLGPDPGGSPALEHASAVVVTDPVVPTAIEPCVAFAEQFVVDVSGITDAQRAALQAAVGPGLFRFTQVVYVTDVFLRARIGLERLFGVRCAPAVGAAPTDGDLWSQLEDLMRAVARLDALDPVTAELVRLRGARVHDCRLCRSRRSVRALDAAGGAQLFDAADPATDPEAELTDRQRVALRLTDALVTLPSSIDEELRASVHAQLTTAEVVEIVLDVVRNAANKIAVALGADAPVVADGVEYYELDARGEVVADADIEVVRAALAG